MLRKKRIILKNMTTLLKETLCTKKKCTRILLEYEF